MMRALVRLLIPLLIWGCGDPTIDTSTDEAFEASLKEVRESLHPGQREAFDEAMTALTFSEMGDLFTAAADPEAAKVRIRSRLNGKTALEIIDEGHAILVERWRKQLDQAQQEVIAVQADVDSLELQKREAEGSVEHLAKFKVIRSRFEWSESLFLEKPMIELTVKNETPHAISRAYFESALATPGRSVPWVKDTFTYQIGGGIEPQEEATWRLAPNMFGEWSKAPKDRSDMVLTVTTLRLDGPDGEPLYNSEFPEGSERALERKRERMNSLGKSIVELEAKLSN